MKKFLVFLVLGAVIVLIAFNHQLIGYAFMQGRGQLHILMNAVPVNEVLADPDLDEQLKEKVRLMQEIRDFAIDSLGLTDSNNYTSMYDQKGKDVLWNVSASEPFELKSVQWEFPFLGSFSYKGFFDLERARMEEQELLQQGYDTRIRSVSAWSTLGWFDDPILSKNLKRGPGSLADLVIHELTHSTIFVRDSLTFNENLASFIGEQGAARFIASKYGPDSKELHDYKSSGTDFRKYTNHMLLGAAKLDSLYGTFKPEALLSDKERFKKILIREIVGAVDTISFSNKKRFEGIFDKKLPNNAYFLSYHRYTSKISIFEALLAEHFDGNLSAFIAHFKKRYSK